jgi:ribonuclease HI
LALSSHTVSSKLVLQGLSIQNRVQLFWVPGHCGIIGNEKVDGLAGVGSKSNFYGPGTLFARPKVTVTKQ